MVVYSFYIFDRHTECIYKRRWHQRPLSDNSKTSRPISNSTDGSNEPKRSSRQALSAEDDAKLVYGVIYSLRTMVRKIGGEEDNFLSYRTNQYRLHYYETATNLRFVMVTDIKSNSMRMALHQIYVNLYVEFVVKNPLSPVEHPGGLGVNNELFEEGLDQFVTRVLL